MGDHVSSCCRKKLRKVFHIVSFNELAPCYVEMLVAGAPLRIRDYGKGDGIERSTMVAARKLFIALGVECATEHVNHVGIVISCVDSLMYVKF